ncbi:hypothetical protein BGZ65_003617 [Modicella reniformis]|uniref:Uncharacterized protein n=1 Tax=Modicella reniformis TaxID=1440133 RepID=A0A9P6ILA1_9FUNG|nr:hypothetical protein BGZ65_003617 [Modicella reniformis]
MTNTTTNPTSAPTIQIEERNERGRTHDIHPISEHGEYSQNNNGSRRSSISAFVDRLRSRSRSRSRSRPRPSIDGFIEEDKEYVYSRRKSSEIHGEYASTLRAQVEHMEKLRSEQAKAGVTHNVDGIPIPPPVNSSREGRRRSIIGTLSRSSSRSRSRSPDRSEERHSSKLAVEDKEFKYSRRKSQEIAGPYADALKSQLDYMENLRENQIKKGITHNVDGILIPPPVNPGSRRSSITGSGLIKNQI